jgi:hypothetical protein
MTLSLGFIALIMSTPILKRHYSKLSLATLIKVNTGALNYAAMCGYSDDSFSR